MEQNELKLIYENFCKRNANIHIHMSNDVENFSGVLRSGNFMELNYIVSGKAKYDFGNSVYEAEKGDLVFINTETPFMCTEIDGEPLIYYSLMFNPSILYRDKTVSYPHKLLEGSFAFYSLKDKDNNPHIFFNFSKTSHSMFGEFFNKMYLEYKKAISGYNDILMAYFTLIVINAVRLNETLGNADEKIYRKQAVEFVQTYINRCYCDANISVTGLADRVYLNPDYLGRIFKRATGNSITDALQKKRIERVCVLLTSTDRSINDIASECGFTDMHFFYKVFKKRMGVLPGQYRENTKK